MLLEQLNGEEEGIMVVSRILDVVETPFRIKGCDIVVTFSIGIAFSDSSTAPDKLLDNADEAMYLAKKNGKARYEIYRPAPDARDNGTGVEDVPE